MVSQIRNVALGVVGILLFCLMVRPCRGQILLTEQAQPRAARRGEVLAAAAVLKKRKATDWMKVCAADAAEVAALNAASTAAMKAGDANAVVAAQGLLKVVEERLGQEKAEPPFPIYFQLAGPTAGLGRRLVKLEAARNKAVAAAAARWHRAQVEFHGAVVAADLREVALWKAGVKAAMKAGDAHAVVVAMAGLKQARQRLRQDSPAVPGRPNLFGGQNSGNGNGAGGGINIGKRRGNGSAGGGVGAGIAAGHSDGGGGMAPRRDWPKMVKEANEPVAAGSVFSIGAALKNDPHLLVGGRVTWHIGTGLGLALSGRQRVEWRRLRLEIRRHFRAIRQDAARRETAEYRYQLGLLEAANPNATVWQVAWPVKHAEQIERAKVSRLAKKEEHADINALAKCFRVARLEVRVVGLKGVAVPTSGPIYGVILAARSVASHPQTPEFSLPSGWSLRVSALGQMAGLQYVPFPGPGSFLGNVPAVTIPAMPVGAERAERITVLYCGRYPRYKGPGGGARKGHGYVFMMKGGGTLRASTYTTGQSYYHAVWDGVDFPIAKSLVVKIKAR